jgi:thiamine biosynthesis lipoprotein
MLGLLGAAGAVLVAGCVWQYHIEGTGTKGAAAKQEASVREVTPAQSASQNTEETVYSKDLFAMDTYMTFKAYGSNAEEAVEAASKEVQRLDALLSTGNASSDVSKINAEGSGTISDDEQAMIERALELYDTTDGLFDITIYPLMELWGFPTQEYYVPTEDEIQALLKYVDAGSIQLDGDQLTLAEGQEIDLGAIAKGYTSNRLMEVYREYGVTSGMVYLGGNVQTLNTKPDGSKWKIGIQSPEETQGSVSATVSVDNKAVITSGGYERYFEQDGKTYIHILDPRTGYPADNDLISVTIVSEDGMLADALSTSLFIMGEEQAETYWRTYSDAGQDFEMVLITSDGTLHVTEGLTDDFSTDQTYEVIQKEES